MNLIQAAAGRTFTVAVRDSVREAKASDVLRSVTVVVPSNLAGLSLRRLLGSNLLDSEPQLGPAGIVNVNFATPFQFASTIAANRLAADGFRPLTTAVLAAAVRHVLRSSPGRFGPVAQHTATETALVRAYAELTTLTAEHRHALRANGSERVAGLVALVEQVADHLRSDESGSGYHDESAVFLAAVAELKDRAEGARPIEGSVVLAGPYEQGESARKFLAAAAERSQCHAIVALTGDAEVDGAAVQQMTEISGAIAARISASRPLPTALVPAADSDEEARSVARRIMQLVESGEPLDRIAVFYPSRDPYARTLREQFDQAGVPTAGPDHRRLSDSMTGRLIRRILALGAPGDRSEHFSRAAVLSLANAAPVRGPNGKPIRAGAWENLSRSAGVIGGQEDWHTKLGRHVDNLDDRANDPRNAERTAGFFDSIEREQRATKSLREFVEWIHGRTEPLSIGPTWQERSEWAATLLADLLPATNRRSKWPETEVDAVDRIEVVLRRVGVLDRLEPDAPYSAFVRAVELELDVPAGSRGRFGTGVLVAPLASSAGLDLDHVFVVGLSEGVCPRPIRDDTLLPDSDREVLPTGLLPTRNDRLGEQRSRFLTALGSGAKSRTLVMPHGDHRNGRVRTVSRWWIEALRGLGASDEITSQTWAQAEVPELEDGGSFTQASHRAANERLALSVADLQLQNVLRSGSPHPAEVVPLRSIAMEAEARDRFSRFTGDLAGVSMDPVVTDERPMSATRLETWATCPRRFFFSQFLGLGAIEAPDKITEISALDRGSMWHAILEDFVSEALPGEAHAPSTPDTPWTDSDRDRLRGHAFKHFAEYENSGLTGRPLLWEIEKEKLLADLDKFLQADNEMRAELGTTPLAVEFSIGMDDESDTKAALITLPDGRELKLRGFADRVDKRTDGSPVVFDYKTSKNMIGNVQVQTLLDRDPVLAGSKLQLGVYAEAASQHFGAVRSSAWYWYTSEKGNFKYAGYEWTARHKDVFTRTIQTIIFGIEGGLFPPNPGEYNGYFNNFSNCSFCDFTAICSQRRDEECEDAVVDERLGDFVAMHDPPNFANGGDDPDGLHESDGVS